MYDIVIDLYSNFEIISSYAIMQTSINDSVKIDHISQNDV